MMTSLPLPRSRSWVNWQSHPLDDSPPSPNVHISGILWDKVWKGIPGTGTACANFLKVSIRWKCSRNCRSAFHLVNIESMGTGIGLEWQAEELGLYSEHGESRKV